MWKSARKRISLATHVLLSKSTPRQAHRDIRPITSEEVAEAREFFPLDKFFVFGHARSGTSVLARLLRLHPEIHCNYQAHFFTRLPLLQSLVADEEIGAWLARGSNRWNRGSDLSPVVLRAVADFILERDARREYKRIVGDKSPNSLLDGESVRLMHKVYPDASLVYIVRDGRDTVISHRFQAFIDSPQRLSKEDRRIRSDFIRDPGIFLRRERSVFTKKGIRNAADGWVRNLTETDLLGKELYDNRYCSLRYEDLLKQPWQEMCRLWTFLDGCPPTSELQEALTAELQRNPDADWQQQKAWEIAEPLQKGQQGSWRELFTPRDQKIFQQIAGETLKSWGYAEN